MRTTFCSIAAIGLSAVLALTACRTTSDAPNASDILNFDDDATQATIVANQPFQFCADSTSFNIINAFWLANASTYAYSTQATIEAATKTIRDDWHAKLEFISNDTSNILQHHMQAVWMEFPDFAILIFRGTQNTIQDLVTDSQFRPMAFGSDPKMGFVHRGFSDGLDVIWPDVVAKLATLAGQKKPLFITGHSMGGALATLTAARLMLRPEFKTLAASNLSGLYTYGSPRVGDEAFAESMRNQAMQYPAFHMARFRNFDDIVTRLPPSWLIGNYEDIGSLFYFDAAGRLYSSTVNVNLRRLFMPHDISVSMVEEVNAYNSIGHTTRFSDHSMKGYLSKLGTEYNYQLDWMIQNKRALCDMGMYAMAAPQAAKPVEIKPQTNSLPIATVQQHGGIQVKDCCWCSRTWYYSQWGADAAFKQENFLSVIQEGEVASGSCMYPGGKPQGHVWWQGKVRANDATFYDQYYRYSSCQALKVVGDRCVLGAEVFRDNRRTGQALRTDSWVPETR